MNGRPATLRAREPAAAVRGVWLTRLEVCLFKIHGVIPGSRTHTARWTGLGVWEIAMRGTGAGRQWIAPLRGTGSPSDRALHRLVGWYAVGFRLWIAVAVVVAAPLAATTAVSGAWLA